MKYLVNSILYIIIATIVIFLTLIVIINTKPINHTHNKELEELLINKKWTAYKYYNDELLKVILIFNDDKTITYKYTNDKHVSEYYNKCNKFEWTDKKRILNIVCNNESYEPTTIEIYSITKDKLEIKLKNEYLKLKAMR